MNTNCDLNSSRESFERDGYVAFRGLVSGTSLDEIQANVERFIHDVVPTLPREHVFYEDKDDPSTLKQIQQMGQHDEFFGRLMNDSLFRQIAEHLLQEAVVPKNMQYFNKPPGVGRTTPPHQDGFYFIIEPCAAVTMWLALDDVDEENGCVRYVPGSHKAGMRRHGRTNTLGFSQAITDYNASEETGREVAMHAKPGDLLVHHAMTIHLAGGNRSATRTRRSLGFIYYARRARVDERAYRRYQQCLAQEMAAARQI